MAVKKCWAIFHYDPKVVQTGTAYYNITSKEGGIKTFWHDEKDVLIAADELAAKNPGDQIVILESKYIIEAKIPETVAKAWKENGELLPIDKIAPKSKKTRIDAVELQLREAVLADAPRGARREGRPERQPNPIGGAYFNPFGQLQPAQGVAPGQAPDAGERQANREPGPHDRF